MQTASRAELALLGITALWGFSFVVTKDALDQLGPHALLALRFGVAALAVAAVDPRRLLGAAAASWRTAALLGALLYLAFALQTVGLTRTTPARSAFLTGMAVLFVPVVERLGFGVPVAARTGLGLCIALVGLGLLTRPGHAAALNPGDVLTLGCALAFAGHIVAVGRRTARHSSRELALLQLVWVFLFSLPAALAVEGLPGPLSARAAGAVLFLGLGCSALALWAQTWAQRHTAAARAGFIFALEPVFAALVSVGLYGERLTPGQWAGGGLVVAGVWVAIRK